MKKRKVVDEGPVVRSTSQSLVRQVLEAERQTEPLAIVKVLGLVEAWLWRCERIVHRGVSTGKGNGLDSQVYLIGATLCGILDRVPGGELREWPSEAELLGASASRILLHGESVAALGWEELVDVVSGLQIELPKMIYWDDERGGYWCDGDVTRFCVLLMRRLGHFLAHDFDAGKWEGQIEAIEVLSGGDVELVEGRPAAGTWVAVRQDATALLIFALHGCLTLLWLTTKAQVVPEDLSVELHAHHKEASLDVYYEMSMISDLAPGFLVQYKCKFSHLFHSISQVVYFHFPQYRRRVQESLGNIVGGNASAVNTLPLLQQVRPEIPVLYEHTGACSQKEHADLPYAWVVLSGFVLLVKANGDALCAKDPRSLLAVVD